jgi:hypothetical protein
MNPNALTIPDYVVAAIEGYGNARASEEGAYNNAAVALLEVFAQLRHWAATAVPVVEVVPRARPDALSLLRSARHALRSYGYGNASTALASGLATDIEQFLAERLSEPSADNPVPCDPAGVPLSVLQALANPVSLESVVMDLSNVVALPPPSPETWRSGARPPKEPGLFERRHFEGGAAMRCRWTGKHWLSSAASLPDADPDTLPNGGVSFHQHIEYRGPVPEEGTA